MGKAKTISTHPATLRLCDPDGFLNGLPICIRAVDLLPEHLGVELDLLLRPADENCTSNPRDQLTFSRQPSERLTARYLVFPET